MAAGTLDLIIDAQTGRLVTSFLSTKQAPPPKFVLGDATPITARLVMPSGSADTPWVDMDLTDKTVRVAIGVPGGIPTAGTYTITYGGDTTTALAYNATAAQVAAALNLLTSIIAAGGVTVTASSTAFKISFVSNGARTAITSNTANLSPLTGSQIATVQEGTGSLPAISMLRLETQPASYVELVDDTSDPVIAVETRRQGDTGISEIKRITFSENALGGSFKLTIGAATTIDIPLYVMLLPGALASLGAAISSLAGIGTGNAVATGAYPEFTITFAASLTNVGDMTATVSDVVVPSRKTGILDNNTLGIVDILAGESSATATLEVEILDDITGDTWTPLQTTCTVYDDVIPNAPSSQTGGPVYILESVADGRYQPMTPRVTTIVSHATPAVNVEESDAVTITAQAVAITSMTTGLTGTPVNFQRLTYRIKDDGTNRAIDWGASFAARGAALPTTTTATKITRVELEYNTVAATWDCVQATTEA